MTLEQVLRKHAPTLTTAGGALHPDQILDDLTEVSRRLWMLTRVTVAMIVSVFIIEIVVGAVYIEKPEVLAGVAGAMGLTIAGAIERMTRVSKELAETDLLIVLSRRLTPEQIEKVVRTLLEQRDRRPRNVTGSVERHT